MKIGNKVLGRGGENAVAEYLNASGCRILERNYRNASGEADIIVEEPSGTIVFVEVKTRSGEGFGTPAEAVTREKQRKYINLAKGYIVAKRLANRDVRFDVYEVSSDGKINPIVGAFEN